MQGLAARVSASTAIAADKIQLYYNATQSNLALKLYSSDSSSDSPSKTLEASSTARAGIIAEDSQLGTADYLGIHVIVGITKPQGTSTTNDVSVISPVYRILKKTEISNHAIAICSSGDQAWVYYLK